MGGNGRGKSLAKGLPVVSSIYITTPRPHLHRVGEDSMSVSMECVQEEGAVAEGAKGVCAELRSSTYITTPRPHKRRVGKKRGREEGVREKVC